jgi:hypothetical protein
MRISLPQRGCDFSPLKKTDGALASGGHKAERAPSTRQPQISPRGTSVAWLF